MDDKTIYGAPWGGLLKGMTAFVSLLMLGMVVIGFSTGPRDKLFWVWILGMVVVPLSILAIGACFSIRGYVVTAGSLQVLRPGWRTRLDLSGLRSAEADPEAMSRSIKTFGNGGLFCFAGTFWNKRLGGYRAFATDLERAVVLKFPTRTVVVTPDRPADFVARIKALRGL